MSIVFNYYIILCFFDHAAAVNTWISLIRSRTYMFIYKFDPHNNNYYKVHLAHLITTKHKN